MGEILRYIRESEQQKEMVKKQEKKNELEKDKKVDVKKTPIEDAQSQFSTVNSQTISSLTSGSATPKSLSRPIDSRSLFDSLLRVADIQGENPNSGHVSFSTLQSNPLSSSHAVDPFSIIGAINSSNRSNLSSSSSSVMSAPTYESSDRTLSPPQSTASTVSSAQSILSPFNSFTSALTDYLTDKQDQPPPIEPSMDEESVDTDIIEEETPPQQPEIQIEPPQEIINTEPLTVEPEPEQQLIVYEPEKATTQSATATQQIIGLDNSTLPAFLRPINKPSPTIRFNDLMGLRPTAAETKDIRQARNDKLDKKPVLTIEAQTTQDEDTTKEDEKKSIFISPTKKEDSLKGVGAFIQGSPIKSNQPSKLTDLLKKSPTKAAEEPESQVTESSVEGFDEFSKYINSKVTYNWKLGEILI